MIFPKLCILNDKTELIIRKADTSDAPIIIEYVEEVNSETDFLSRGKGEFQMSVEDEEKYIQKQKESENKIMLLGVVNNQIVSMISLEAQDKLRKRHFGTMGITVRKNFWSKGIGSEMVSALLEWARHTSIIRKINLEVQKRNERAIHLYERFGFEVEGIIKRDSIIDGRFVDAHVMGICIDN